MPHLKKFKNVNVNLNRIGNGALTTEMIKDLVPPCTPQSNKAQVGKLVAIFDISLYNI